MTVLSAPDCLFCAMVAGTIETSVVLQTEEAFAFRDINPQAPTHVLVIPTRHVPNVGVLAGSHPDEVGALFDACRMVADQEGIAESGYRMVANTGADAQQTVFHAHVHVIGGREMGWPPG